MQDLKIKRFLIELLGDIFILVGIAIIIIISIPLIIIYSAFSIIYRVSEFIVTILYKFWMSLLDAFSDWMEALKPNRKDN